MNVVCKTCSDAHNGINGRYCEVLKRYVEHIELQACEVKTKKGICE